MKRRETLTRELDAGAHKEEIALWLELRGHGAEADDLRLFMPAPLLAKAVAKRLVRPVRRPVSWLERTVRKLKDLAATKRGQDIARIAHRDREAKANVSRETLPPGVPPATEMR